MRIQETITIDTKVTTKSLCQSLQVFVIPLIEANPRNGILSLMKVVRKTGRLIRRGSGYLNVSSYPGFHPTVLPLSRLVIPLPCYRSQRTVYRNIAALLQNKVLSDL